VPGPCRAKFCLGKQALGGIIRGASGGEEVEAYSPCGGGFTGPPRRQAQPHADMTAAGGRPILLWEGA
jgi:hypothetical protein